jgi:heme-degrading monooxygenase HmoA
MYVVVGTANLDAGRADEAAALAQNILSNISEAPGFVSGVFARSADGTAGRSMVVFDDEQAAKAAAERAPGMIPSDGPTELVSMDVFELVAQS